MFFVLQGIFGALLFNETMSIYWILGMMFTIIGISLIATDPLETHKAKDSWRPGYTQKKKKVNSYWRILLLRSDELMEILEGGPQGSLLGDSHKYFTHFARF